MNNYDENIARFRGTAMLYGLKGLNILKNSSLSIVGIGGVGSWALEALVRTGIGNIRIFDHDTVSITNTNRQCHALSSSLGQSKAAIFSRRLKDINPALNIEYYEEFISPDNISKYFPSEKAREWYVIDAIDSIDSKVALINHLKRTKYRFISSGGAGGKITASEICIADLSKSQSDPLLAKVKLKLNNEYGFGNSKNSKMGIKCAFINSPRTNPKLVNSPEELQELSDYFDNGTISFGACMHVTAALGLKIAEAMIERIIQDGNAT
ncbi:MAG: ThiF family adenylyltransferase [Succinivibrionaceae bacterium]